LKRSDKELVQRLRRVPLFSLLGSRALRTVAAAATASDVAEGDVMVREGAGDRDLFVILRGEALATRGGTVVVTLGVGDFFGEFALIAAEPRSATITASTDMRVLILSAEGMDEAIRREPVLGQRMRESRERRMRMLERTPATAGPPAL
jgi:CRP-like cAMP-binding protein